MIRNCSWGYSCKASWSDLMKTADENIRFCENCEREVHSCDNREDLLFSISLNRCVNFSSSLLDSNFDESNNRLTGMPGPGVNTSHTSSNNQLDSEFDDWDFDDDIPF